MKRMFISLALALALLHCSAPGTKDLNTEFKTLNNDELEKVTEALPESPSVIPAGKRRLLVFSLAWGYKHESGPWGKPVFDLMGQKTGAFEAVVTDDPAEFEPQKIKQYDAILFNNTNNEIFMPEFPDSLDDEALEKALAYDATLKKSLQDYLMNGGGLAVLHAGLASFRQWPEFGNIIGARFDNHPWQFAVLKKDDPEHPLVAAFADASIAVTDEIYQFKEPYSRDNLRVLLSIDTKNTDMTLNGINRTDGDFALSWIKEYGKGRVFYNAFGHQKAIFWNPEVLQHWLDGIQFVLGDLDCDITSIPKTL